MGSPLETSSNFARRAFFAVFIFSSGSGFSKSCRTHAFGSTTFCSGVGALIGDVYNLEGKNT